MSIKQRYVFISKKNVKNEIINVYKIYFKRPNLVLSILTIKYWITYFYFKNNLLCSCLFKM